MAADAPAPPQLRNILTGADTFTAVRIERIVAFVAGVGSAVLAVQAFLVSLAAPVADAPAHVVIAVAVFASLALMIAACLSGRLVRGATAGFAIVFPLALAAWPVLGLGPVSLVDDPPWFWYLLNVATAAAVVVFPLPLQVGWTIGVPVLYGVARAIDTAGEDLERTLLDVVFALILGGVLLTLGWMLRTMARGVDRARAEANATFAEAAAADAAEKERIAVAAVMHDSVLAALIAVSRVDSDREAALAAAMSRDALTRLADAEWGNVPPATAAVPVTELADGIARLAGEHGAAIRVACEVSGESLVVPGPVARALAQAAGQAIANAVQHAGGEGLAVRVRADAGAVHVVVSDTGAGFDVDAVPDDRLGIRGSIVARIAAIAGRTGIRSDATGTTVTMSWEEER
ncbi:sensor histidine kinase [Microbacterium sp. No. 7]|uniref:sensor histidine kinase n=1 Tax=Microbacterium sp. No. 7 TaxID=1714373 RepID=UPI0006CFA576|nr:ATP-binding protein [Microbacterium sp. No. 7]ALJ19364.1 hypothetical protein AOA12_05375 [Microbacterium sp. No. 7]